MLNSLHRARQTRRFLPGLVVLACLCWAAPALAGGSVWYSYEQVKIDGKAEFALIPHQDAALGQTLTKSRAIEAFQKVRNYRRKMYGNTSIRIAGAMPGKAKVSVVIDPASRNYALIIMAEVVYTLTELGVSGVEFPGYTKGAISRADVPFSVYTLTRPLWQALPPDGDMTNVRVQLPDGQVLDGPELAKRWKADRSDLKKALFSYLKDEQIFTVSAVLSRLPTYGVPFASEVTPLLKHESPVIRDKALSTLEGARDEAPVLEAVAKMLDAEKDATLAGKAAAFLGAAKDKKYSVLAPLYALKTGKPDEAKAAMEKLASYKGDARVIPALTAQLVNKDATIAAASAKSLETLKATEAQRAALKNDKISAALRLTIATSLADAASQEDKLAGLGYLAQHAAEREATAAIAKLVKLNNEQGRKAAEAFLADKDGAKREAAATALVDAKSVDSLPAFGRAIKATSDERLEDAGYTLMASLPMDKVQEQTRVKDAHVQRLAYRALGEKARQSKNSKVFDTLKAGLASGDPLIRGACARALGAFADAKANEALKTVAKDKSSDVRRDLARALASFKDGEQTDTLVAYLDDPSPQVVAAAIDTLAARSEAAQWDKIKGLSKSSDEEVRASALSALAKLVGRQDKKGVSEVISLLSGGVNDKSVIVRKAAIQALGTFKDNTAVYSIASQLGASEPDVRLAAVEALGNTGHAEAANSIVDKLNDGDLKVRRAAVLALGRLKDKSAREGLQKQLEREGDAEIKALIRKTLQAL